MIVVALLVLLVGKSAFAASERFAPLPNATYRVQQTLAGLFSYYWRHDATFDDIWFFFDCAQIGTVDDPDHCSCYDPGSCIQCYRWWDAVALEAIANHGIYTNTTTNASVAEKLWAHSPYNHHWEGLCDSTQVEDFMWYSMAYLRVYQWLNNSKWLNRSIAIYDWAWQYAWDNDCGGFWWMTCGDAQVKNSITNLQVLHVAAKLAYMFPKEPNYLRDALRVWDWFFSFDSGYGLMTNVCLVSTGAVPEKCCNSSTSDPFKKCRNSRVPGTSYNQGLLMSASAFLYNRTQNETYLNVALHVLTAILTNYTTNEGILIDEPRGNPTYIAGYDCLERFDPGGNWYLFNGIFMSHLSYFVEVLANGSAMSTETMQKIKNLVQISSDAAWNRSAVFPPFPSDDKCNTGSLTPTVQFPKFHWWWGHDNVTHQIVPPDPRIYYSTSRVRCYSVGGRDTQLWEGRTYSEEFCMQNCTANPECSKYLFHSAQATAAIADCWIWSYNRSNHICDQYDLGYTVGVMRPIGNVTCAGQCDSPKPLKLERGMCYCDANCTTYLDCCPDYADHCTPRGNYSCKDQCRNTIHSAVHGGGYCWCIDSCGLGENDNISFGSCCPEYNQLCLSGGEPMPTCLDARTQTSALNLFLAHLRLMQVK